MDPVTVIGAIGTIAETVGKVKSLFAKKPKPSDPVKELKPYLEAILSQMQVIRALNVAILEMVSQLPAVIRIVVRDELKQHQLDSAYQELRYLNSRFEALGDEAQFDVVTSATFNTMWNDLSIIFDMEPRIGFLGPMLAQMEFCDIATKRQPSIRNGFRSILNSRARRLEAARDFQIESFKKETKILNDALSSPYIVESNSNKITSSYDLLTIGAPDRSMTEVYYVAVTVEIVDGLSCCRIRTHVVQEKRERQVLDTTFAANRNEALAVVEASKKRLNYCESAIAALQDDIATLDWYATEILSADKNLADMPSFLFIPADHEKGMLDEPFMPRADACYSR